MKNIYQIICSFALLCVSMGALAQVPILNSYTPAPAVIYLDFDGQTVNGTSWNTNGPIECNSSNVTSAQVNEIFNRVAEDYRPFKINVTTDSTKYWAAPATQRVRVILTTSSSWYGSAGGVSYINSFCWGDNTPAFVFTQLLNYTTKSIAEAASHEAGHTLGLRHQSSYDNNCTKTAEYNPGAGTGEISWAPIMGVGYSKNLTLWNNGANPYGCTNIQDDLGIITSANNGIGFRADDFPNSIASATPTSFTNNTFVVGGIIETHADVDVIKFTTPANGRVQINAIPFTVGSGNVGSNIDIQVELMNGAGTVIGTYNPSNLLSASIDTSLNTGTYYLSLKGMGNAFAPNYASLGSYTINGAFTAAGALPLHKLLLHAVTANNDHKFDWEIVADETLVEQSLEVSTDGRNFTTVANPATNARTFSYAPSEKGTLLYRLNVRFDNDRQYYSNIVTLKKEAPAARPYMTGNFVSNAIPVNSPAAYTYTIFDMNGRAVSKGNLVTGSNSIPTGFMTSGLYIMQYYNGREQYTEKFMKQ